MSKRIDYLRLVIEKMKQQRLNAEDIREIRKYLEHDQFEDWDDFVKKVRDCGLPAYTKEAIEKEMAFLSRDPVKALENEHEQQINSLKYDAKVVEDENGNFIPVLHGMKVKSKDVRREFLSPHNNMITHRSKINNIFQINRYLNQIFARLNKFGSDYGLLLKQCWSKSDIEPETKKIISHRMDSLFIRIMNFVEFYFEMSDTSKTIVLVEKTLNRLKKAEKKELILEHSKN